MTVSKGIFIKYIIEFMFIYPLYSNNVKSNIGKQFPKLVRQHFSKSHKLNKIFNKNTLKVSYSCIKNMSSILTNHNKRILAENEKQYECNCRNKDEHPLENKYLTPRVIHESPYYHYLQTIFISLNTSRKFYIGLCDTPFKERYNNHKHDFRTKCYEKSTEFSKYIWSLEKSGIEFTMRWKILSHVKEMTKLGYCSLCLTKELWLLRYFDSMHLLKIKI